MIRCLGISLIATAVGLAGCGGDDETMTGQRPGGSSVEQNESARPPSTTSAGDRGAIERRLVRYFERNFKMAPWYRDVRRFEIRGGVPVPDFEEIQNATVVVHTRLDAQDRRAAREICAGVFGADVADVGGTVRVVAEDGDRVAKCQSDL